MVKKIPKVFAFGSHFRHFVLQMDRILLCSPKGDRGNVGSNPIKGQSIAEKKHHKVGFRKEAFSV